VDLKKAVQYYLASAAAGYSSAYCNLGYLYLNGCGVEKSLEKAFDCFNQAMETENITATFNLALLLLEPESAHYDPARAKTLLRKCALAGFADPRALLEELDAPEPQNA
jgi:TPR repeat protein